MSEWSIEHAWKAWSAIVSPRTSSARSGAANWSLDSNCRRWSWSGGPIRVANASRGGRPQQAPLLPPLPQLHHDEVIGGSTRVSLSSRGSLSCTELASTRPNQETKHSAAQGLRLGASPPGGAIECKAPRRRRHLRQPWHCGICNLQNQRDYRVRIPPSPPNSTLCFQ
jgi:hypothetical protein